MRPDQETRRVHPGKTRRDAQESTDQNRVSTLAEREAKGFRCECPDGCRKADGSDAFIGMLHVSDSSSVCPFTLGNDRGGSDEESGG